MVGRDGTGTSLNFRPGNLYILFFFVLFYIKYSKILLNLNAISHRIHENPFVEVDLINYHYIEAKTLSKKFLLRSDRSGLRFLDRFHL